MSLTPGDKLGPYSIVSQLGEGGMGEVYKAHDTRLDRFVAIKVSKTAFDQRFEREARAVAALNHPNICTLYDVGPNYLVMEFVDGAELRGPLPVAKAIELASKILDGLDAAHRKGITHRDLKPANVMVTKSELKVMDFGLAKIAPAATTNSDAEMTRTAITTDNNIVGTLYYMAPEQLQGKPDVDTRADIFAFGCMFYEMLTGKRAFEGTNAASVIAGIMERPAPSIGAVAPAALDRVLAKCLEKDRDERWQCARDVKTNLLWAMEEPAPVKVVRSRSWIGTAAVAVLALGLGVAATYFAIRPAPPPEARLDIVTPPTIYPVSFALSPDGQQVAYLAGNGNASQLWVRPLASASAQPVAGTEGARYPFWSPDSRSLGFFADGKLKRVDLGGTAPQPLADVRLGHGGTWSAEGIILFSFNAGDGVFRIPATGGQAIPVTRLSPGQTSHRQPRFLPDSQRFLVYVAGSQPGIYLGELGKAGASGTVSRLLTAADSAGEYMVSRDGAGWLVFVRQNTLIARRFDAAKGQLYGDPVTLAQSVGADGFGAGAFSVSHSGLAAFRTGTASTRQLVWFNRAGERTGTLGTPDAEGLFGPELAPDGRRTAVTRGAIIGGLDVWLTDGDRSTRFTFDPANDFAAVWSPDGSRVVFSSNRKGHYDLYIKPADGSGPEQVLLASADDKLPSSWSPDGRFVLYLSSNNGGDLMVLPVLPDRDGKPYPFLSTPFNERIGVFSPDGKWVAYQSNEAGRNEVYVRPFPGPGGVWQISAGGGSFPRWRADGKELYYLAPGNRLMAAAITAQGGSITPGPPAALFTANFAFGNNRPQYDVARDGRFLVNLELTGATTAPITLLMNWKPPK